MAHSFAFFANEWGYDDAEAAMFIPHRTLAVSRAKLIPRPPRRKRYYSAKTSAFYREWGRIPVIVRQWLAILKPCPRETSCDPVRPLTPLIRKERE